MRKLSEVEEAKALMLEARDWSVWRWLIEKGRVRAAADRATGALARVEKQVKAGWSEDPTKGAQQKLKEAEDAAETARLDAEATFDEAERRLSAALAREGTRKAIDSWELREKAIRKAEALGRRK